MRFIGDHQPYLTCCDATHSELVEKLFFVQRHHAKMYQIGHSFMKKQKMKYRDTRFWPDNIPHCTSSKI